MINTAILPGTFDPITLGHLSLIERGAKMAQELIVAVAASPSKQPLFDLDTRVRMISKAVEAWPNVKVIGFLGLLTDFAAEHNCELLIRGVRTTMDFEYEMGLAHMYRQLLPQMECVLLPPKSPYSYLSSTAVRELLKHGGDITHFVPKSVLPYLKASF